MFTNYAYRGGGAVCFAQATACTATVAFQGVNILHPPMKPCRAQRRAFAAVQAAVSVVKELPAGGYSLRVGAPGAAHLATFEKDNTADPWPIM
ncbi:hypothetical protein ASV28_23485 [Enterobacter cloacae subsp. cloacae]|nr:hypothetical protein ASV28_23485 [Enterobacter cloacae subsp. cloacae]KTH27242.1 hypothetical protein ASV29_24770 [Enterobacter cloacae subsp. cloacae]